MNTFSPIVLALALSAGTAQTKPTPDNLIHNKVQTVAMANRQACIEQGVSMSETLVRIIRIKFETALITPSRISLEVQPVYAESAWNEFAETVHTDGRLSSRGVVKIPAENPLVKFSFVMNSNGQHSHDIQCLNN